MTSEALIPAITALWPATNLSNTSGPISPRPGLNAAITAMWPVRALPNAGVSKMSSFTGVTFGWAGIASGWRQMAVTLWPRDRASARILDPTCPVAPIRAMFMACSSSYSGVFANLRAPLNPVAAR